jgi:hypothetical protein
MFTYNPGVDARSSVRMLIPDRTDSGHLFEDAEIDAFLTMESAVVKRAAAAALETIASDNAMVLKVIRLLDLTTDGAKTSDALLARAKLLRAQVADEDYTGGVDWAEMVVDDFSLRQRLDAEALRAS